ncbi:DUF2087 domain-containing protein [Isoptericola sp. b441]|uniref:DUF2087 domain-containing protein n=1 Tax=Actinotalea lenta TaxID=3064654 RepID=A0ABT9D6J0_9CELL|nr:MULTISPECIES: DUF2087 domain-containing protein [unclassified Isoptericola]MDO8106447.1 DUF2087 domain-containing protein [Isoptericola sp. b441]MDO8121837.1 DUF2087 domain-containing protein [Isoptericola sp. b490]
MRPPVTVPYGTQHPAQFAELSLPDGPARGVVVLVHGGFWRARYGLEGARPLATDLARRGWVAWNLEYRRVGDGGGHPATFDDVAAGIDALRPAAHEHEFGLDTVLALGHSAGGHLATWAASRTRCTRWAHDDAVELTGVVAQAAVLDLVAAADLGAGAVAQLLGHAPGTADVALDPIRQVPLGAPVRCVHGRADDVVPPTQSEAYVSAARAAGGDVALLPVDGGHFAVIDVDDPSWPVQLWALASMTHPPDTVRRFLDRGRLERMPRRQADRALVRRWLATRVSAVQDPVSERALTDRLAAVVRDPVGVRRDLVDAGLLSRTRDGAEYWRTHVTEFDGLEITEVIDAALHDAP